MPRYEIARIYGVSGHVTTVVDAPDPEVALQAEQVQRSFYQLTPPVSRSTSRIDVDEIWEEIDQIEETATREGGR